VRWRLSLAVTLRRLSFWRCRPHVGWVSVHRRYRRAAV